MWPATAWDDSDWGSSQARGWSVMSRLRERQSAHHRLRREAQRRIDESASHMRMMTAAVMEQDYQDRLAAGWRGGWSVLAFLFAMPDDPNIDALDLRGDYFDVRTGQRWDLFFPGYYRSKNAGLERGLGSRPVGKQFTSDWYFNANDFNTLRDHLQSESLGQWSYSGAADLVLVNVWIPDAGTPTIDWASTQSGSIQAPETLAKAIENISRDLEENTEDASYGIGSVTRPSVRKSDDGTAKKVMIGALAGIVAAIGKGQIGL